MKEALFLKQNSEKWRDYEKIIASETAVNPDIVADVFISLTDDLAYSRTFYPNSHTTVYLNSLASHFHQAIYTNKKENKNRFQNFWKYELPYIFYLSRKNIFLAFIIFGVSMLCGVLATHYDTSFVRSILGDAYVNQTLNNIETGDPMGIYGSMNSTDMFFKIAYNNIQVSFYAIVMGFLFSIGSYFVLFRNGLMVGVFQYFFYQKGLFLTSFLAIWIHGTIEITSIILAGAAGITIGNSILFPGTYSRLYSLKKGMRHAMKMAIGLVPLFILAAMLEGFVTRYYKIQIIGIITISASSAFLIWYLIYRPYQLVKQIKANKTPMALAHLVSLDYFGEKNISSDAFVIPKPKVLLYQIRSFGKVFSDAFLFLKQNHQPLNQLAIRIIVPAYVITSIFISLFSANLIKTVSTNSPKIKIDKWFEIQSQVFSLYGVLAMVSIYITIVIFISSIVIYLKAYYNNHNKTPDLTHVYAEIQKKTLRIFLFPLGYFSIIAVICYVFYLITLQTGAIGVILYLIFFAFLTVPMSLIFFVMLNEKKNFFEVIQKTFELSITDYWKSFGLLTLSLIINNSVIFFISFILGIIMGLINVLTGNSMVILQAISILFAVITALLGFYFLIYNFVLVGINYYSIDETKQFIGFRNKIKKIGKTKPYDAIPEEY